MAGEIKRITTPKAPKTAEVFGLSGTAVDTTFVLTEAYTPYGVPANPPDRFYVLIIYNNSNYDVYFRFTPGITGGIKIAPESVLSIDLGANQKVYLYSDVAGVMVNLSYVAI
jgi:hypothetical protein